MHIGSNFTCFISYGCGHGICTSYQGASEVEIPLCKCDPGYALPNCDRLSGAERAYWSGLAMLLAAIIIALM